MKRIFKIFISVILIFSTIVIFVVGWLENSLNHSSNESNTIEIAIFLLLTTVGLIYTFFFASENVEK